MAVPATITATIELKSDELEFNVFENCAAAQAALIAFVVPDRAELRDQVADLEEELAEARRAREHATASLKTAQGEVELLTSQRDYCLSQNTKAVELAEQKAGLLAAAQLTIESLQAKLTEATTLRTQRIVLIAELTRERDELAAKVRQFEASKVAEMTSERARTILRARRKYQFHDNGAIVDLSRGRFVFGPYSPNISIDIKDRPKSAIEEIEALLALRREMLGRDVDSPTSVTPADASTPGVNDLDYDNGPAEVSPAPAATPVEPPASVPADWV